MPPVIIRRPNGTADWLLMYFHTPVQIDWEGKMQSFPPGTLMLWPDGAAHCYGNQEEEWEHSYLHFHGSSADSLLETIGIRPGPLPLSCPDRLERGIASIYLELTDPRRETEILKLLFEALFRTLARDLREPLRENIPLPFLKIRREMELEDHPRPLAELARRTGYSTARFSVLFRKFFGVPPIRFSHELRMERAADFLMNRNWNVSEVADRVGYAQIQQFSRAFKKYFGVSPEEMRRRDDSCGSGI